MAYVALSDFLKYSEIKDDPAALQTFLDAAENIVENYLGYSPVYQQYTNVLSGSGHNGLALQAKPVQGIMEVLVNGERIPVHNFFVAEEFLYSKNPEFTFPAGKKNIIVSYSAGYQIPDTQEPTLEDDVIDGGDAFSVFGDEDEVSGGGAVTLPGMPQIIVQTVLRIAALLESESSGNIGVTGKNFAESGGRTFVNFINFDKYLLPISTYKLLVI
jgi:hypothetical protein